MKVAIVHTSVDASRGGAETSIVEMAAALAGLGHHITLVTRETGRGPGRPDGLAAVGLPARGIGRTGQLLNFLEDARAYCRAATFDIVHAVVPLIGCDVYQPRGGTYAATQAANLDLIASRAVRRLKALLAPLNRKQCRLRQIEAEMLSANPPFVAAVSDRARDQIADLAPGFPREKLHTVFNACDVQRVAPRTPQATAAARLALQIGPQTDVLLFVAHNFKLKGLRELLGALAFGPASSADRLLLVAGRDRVEPYRELAARSGLIDRVRFLGASADVNSLYAAADALVHPTWYDPCSRVVLEAICHGIPVVTTCRNGAAEALSRECGFTVESPADVRGLSACIDRALTPAARDAALRYSAGARPQLGMERHARNLSQLYEQVIAFRGRRTAGG